VFGVGAWNSEPVSYRLGLHIVEDSQNEGLDLVTQLGMAFLKVCRRQQPLFLGQKRYIELLGHGCIHVAGVKCSNQCLVVMFGRTNPDLDLRVI